MNLNRFELREFINNNRGDVASLPEDYCSMTLGCYKSPPLQEISSRDLSGEVKRNFARTDPYRVNYLVNNSGNEAEVSLELKLN